MNVYFDNAATTKVRDEVIDDISNVLKDCLVTHHLRIHLEDQQNHI